MAHPTDPGGVELRLDVSPSGHPSMVVGDGSGAKSAREAMGEMYLAHGALLDLGKTVEDKSQIAPHAVPVMERAVARTATAQDAMTAQIVALDQDLDQVVRGRVTAAATEIRAHWANQKTPLNDLGKIFINPAKNADTVAAIVAGPSYLSGLSDDNLAMLKDKAAQVLAPEKHALIAETRLALSILDKAATAFADNTTAMLRKWQSKDATIIQDTLNRKQGKPA